ncbi:MAG: ISKra4 family transposase [Phycisphaerae bacterium]|jgi:hypothetical protein
MDLTAAIGRQRASLTGALAEAFIQRRYGEYLVQQEAVCPRCDRTLTARPSRGRTLETLVGPVALTRPYFYCPVCAHGFFPLDEALGLSPQRKQWDVQEAGAKLALEMPYQRAATLLTELTDAAMSDCAIHEVVQQLGQLDVLQVSPRAEELQERIAAAAEGRQWKPIVVLAIDAADVPSRPEAAKGTRPGRKRRRAHRRSWKGEYQQAKGFRFYLVDDDRIVHLISWHQISNDEDFGAALQQVKDAGLIPEEQLRLCAVGDGAPWIWKWVAELYPSARQVLDYYHCSSYLHAVAEAQYGHDPARAAHWLEASVTRLFCGEGAGVIWGLQRLKPASPAAEEAITKTLGYLEKRLHQIDYRRHRKGGYPLGSGAIESAHRFIGHVRLKRSGAWWYRENSNAILALRCALYNGTLERVCRQHRDHVIPTIEP